MSTRWFHVAKEESRQPIASVGGPMRVLVSQQDSQNTCSILEQRLDGPGGPPLHLHHETDEWMTVIEGGPLSIQIGDERRLLHAGESAWIPRGVPHSFNNLSGAPLRMMSVCTPGGIEKHLHAQAEYLNSLEPGQRPDPARVAAIWEGNGIVVGPPLR